MREQTRVGGAASDADYVEFWKAGVSAKGEFRCAECGYGVTVHRALPACPMCTGEIWEQADWSPFARAPESPLR
jgi:rubrerythrin